MKEDREGFCSESRQKLPREKVSIDGEREGQQDVDKLPSLAIQQAGNNWEGGRGTVWLRYLGKDRGAHTFFFGL